MTPLPRHWPTELAPSLRDDLRGWCTLWNVSGIVPEVSVAISWRMTSTLGRAYYNTMTIRLSATLLDPTAAELLRETLCHELAHLAAYRLHGRAIRPHGREWRALLAATGYPPNATIRADALPSCFQIGVAGKRSRRTRKTNVWTRLARLLAR